MSGAWPDDQRPFRPRSAADRPRAGAGPPRAAGDRSRDAILHAATSLATQDGLDGPSAGTLAAVLGVSRAGRPARTASKQDLQLATVAEAARIFDEEVLQPALAAPSGLAQLAAVCEAFFAHLERHMVPGGCFMASAALEMDTRPGPVKDMIASLQARFGELIRGFAATARARNELPPGEDPDRLAFELNGIMLATDTNFAEHDDPAVLDLARQIVRQRLGVGDL
jgi:AcrR family transcriptional regulator